MDDKARAQQILATVEAAWAAYEIGSPELFEFFTADASIFPRLGITRLEGREAYRTFTGRQPAIPECAIQLLHPEVRFFGEAALVTCHERIRTGYRSTDHRVSLLLVPDGDGFKIAHLHVSPLSTPSRIETDGLVEEITTVEVQEHPAGSAKAVQPGKRSSHARPAGAGRQGAG